MPDAFWQAIWFIAFVAIFVFVAAFLVVCGMQLERSRPKTAAAGLATQIVWDGMVEDVLALYPGGRTAAAMRSIESDQRIAH